MFHVPFHECFVTTNAEVGGGGANVEEAILIFAVYSLKLIFRFLNP